MERIDSWINYAGFAIGVASLIVGTWLSILGLRNRYARALYRYQSFLLAEEQLWPSLEKISILYDEQPCDRLTKTHLIFWNGGPIPIDGDRVIDRVRLLLPDRGRVVEEPTVIQSRGAHKFSVSIDEANPSLLYLDFEYLGPQGGARIELLHTGSVDAPQVIGRIKDVPRDIEPLGRILPNTGTAVLIRSSARRELYAFRQIAVPPLMPTRMPIKTIQIPGRFHRFFDNVVVQIITGLIAASVMLGALLGALWLFSAIIRLPVIGLVVGILIAVGIPLLFLVAVYFALRDYIRRRLLRTPRELLPDYWW